MFKALLDFLRHAEQVPGGVSAVVKELSNNEIIEILTEINEIMNIVHKELQKNESSGKKG